MNPPERSSFIFELAQEVGIPLIRNDEDIIEDSQLLTFITKYQERAPVRDEALRKRLGNTPGVFRCTLPYSSYVFRFAYEVLWYMDEVIVRDPLEEHTNNLQPADLEPTKTAIRQTLQVLNMFREAIDSGYLLLYGPASVPPPSPEPPPEIAELLRSKDLVEELDQAVVYGMERRPDSQGRDWIVYQATLESGGLMGWRSENLSGTATSPAIMVGEELPRTTREELQKYLGEKLNDQLRALYPREIHRTLRSLAVAESMNSAVMFYRPVDAAIVSAADGATLDEWRQTAAIGSFNLALPYVEGVPHERLVDLRKSMPQAFLDFRARMAEITIRAMKDDPMHASELARLAVQREVLPQLRGLQGEMDAVTRKMRIAGIGIPAVSATAILAGAVAGLSAQTLLQFAVGGGAALVASVLPIVGDHAKAKANPFWFLWRATGK
jgi:hypothetical protein